MQIRDEQMRAFEVRNRPQFEEELVAHLKEFAPKHSAVIGEAQLRSVVSSGIDRAAQCDFTKRGPVRFFLEMMFMFGSGFDTDPQIPWAPGLLVGNPSDQISRADQLHAVTIDYLNSVAGPQRQYAIDALRRLQHTRLEDLYAPGPAFDHAVISAFRNIYPRKCEYLGEAVLREVIRRGKALASAHGAASEQSAALFIALSFSLGHQFASDPLFPWIAAALDQAAEPNAEARAARLHNRARLYLDRAVSYLEAN
jgi:hypothetical protein